MVPWAPGGTSATSEQRRGEEPRKNGAAGVWHPGNSQIAPSSGNHSGPDPAPWCGIHLTPTPTAHSPLCPMSGAPQCPELTRLRAHLHHRSHGWAMELLFPLPWGPAQHRAPHCLGPGHALLGTLFMGKFVEGDDPTHPRRWSPLWGQLHGRLFPTALKPVTMLCLPQGAMARVPGHVPQGTGLAGARTGQWGEHPSQHGQLGG